MANRVQGMVEFDEYLRRTNNKEAFINRIKTRLSTPYDSIAYYPFGLGEGAFILMEKEGGVSTLDIKDALRDIVVDPVVTSEGGRISIITTDVIVEV